MRPSALSQGAHNLKRVTSGVLITTSFDFLLHDLVRAIVVRWASAFLKRPPNITFSDLYCNSLAAEKDAQLSAISTCTYKETATCVAGSYLARIV